VLPRAKEPTSAAPDPKNTVEPAVPSPAPDEPLGMAATLASGGAGPSSALAPPVVSVNIFPAPHWDKYEFISLLGRGGMGAVYKARDRRLGRIVALKFIHGDDPGLIQRFQQEARAQARLQSPNICQVHEVGFVDGKPYIAMEYVEGAALDKAARGLSLTEKVTLTRDIALAMHIAHEEGIVHRDLKPGNVMVERLGGGRLRPVVMDFGLARDSASSVAQGLTESGAVIGTPAYMSPEQARGEARRLDRRSDVYSLGATLYDLLSGKPPFQDETVVNLLLKVMNDSPKPLRSQLPDVPEALELIVSKCLNKEADQRYPTALALAQDLDRFLSVGRVEARRLGYLYRLRYWAKRNRALSALALALFIGGLGSIAVFVRNHLQNLQREAEAKAEAALAQTLGQSVKDLEWLVRTAYLLPLHDTRYEKGLVRQRMTTIHKDLQSAGEKGLRLGAYVLGRGHLALHEWDAAYEQLSKAEKLGYRDSGLDYALGRVLGEKYSRALDEARKSGDKSFVEKRKKELEAEFLFPARSYLSRSRGQTTESPNYVEALLDYYNEHYDAALLNAHMARKQAPWLYEAAKLEGDVHMVRALAQRDHGDNASAEKSFALAVARYEDAAAIGHSDHQVHEALAEAWIRQEEMDLYRGIDPTPKMQKALTAADHAIEAAPTESYGHTKKAFAYVFVVQHLQRTGEKAKALVYARIQFNESEIATKISPADAYSFNILGIALRLIYELDNSNSDKDISIIKKSHASFERSLSLTSSFPMALIDYAGALLVEIDHLISTKKNPVPAFTKIDSLCNEAIRIDGQYLNAHIVLLTSKIIHLEWASEHGISISDLSTGIAKSIAAIRRINPRSLITDWNELIFYQHLLQNNIDTGADSDSIEKAIEEKLNNIIGQLHNSPDTYNLAANIMFLLSKSTNPQRQNNTAFLAKGREFAKTCISLNKSTADCLIILAQIEAIEAWRTDQGSNGTAKKLKSIKTIINQSIEIQPIENNTIRGCLEISIYVHSRLHSANPRLAQEYITQGLSCIDKQKTRKTDDYRILVLSAELLVRSIEQTQSPTIANEAMRKARAAFTAAFSGNPNLKRRFGEMAKEVERRLADLEAGR